MFKIFYGICQKRKSEHIYSLATDNIRHGGSSTLIVPEQEAVAAEERLYEMSKNDTLIELEVMNFDKLCEAVFRLCGSLSLEYVTDTQKKLLLSRALRELAPSLSHFGSHYDDSAFLASLLAQITEFKYALVTPSSLANASKSIRALDGTDSARLADRLDELALVFSSLNALINEGRADPCDKITRASELIRTKRPFVGRSFYFDSFNGFTAQEYELIASLLSIGADVYVDLCLPCTAQTNEVFLFTEQTRAALLRCAEHAGVQVEFESFEGADDYGSNEIAHLARNFTPFGQLSPLETSNDDVSIVSCRDMFDECEACAAAIARDMREGARCRDIVIVMRSPESFRGMIDNALESFDIPFFFAPKTDIAERSLIRFVLSALTLCKGTLRYSDMIDYLKCSLTDLSSYETDILEDYADKWKISGKIWFSDEGFTMNPRGYVPFRQEDTDALERINELRERAVAPIIELRDNVSRASRVDEFSSAMYAFLTHNGTLEKLAMRAGILKRDGEFALADQEEALWGAFVSVLDELSLAIGNEECTLDEYIKLFKLALDDTEIGMIPQSSDVVTIGDASLMRAGNVKRAYILGCEDGVFPKNGTVMGLLTLDERKTLSEHKLEKLVFDPIASASKELFFFYRALCMPSDKLTLMYSRRSDSGEEQYPSSALLRVDAMLGHVCVDSEELDPTDRIVDAASFAERLPCLREMYDGDALDSLIDENDELCELISRTSRPLCDRNEHVDQSTVDRVIGSELKLSQAATDAYSRCPFSFQCKYSLKLSDKGSEKIEKSDIGTLVHSVLTDYLGEGVDELIKDGDVREDEVKRRIDDITQKRSRLLLEFTPEEKRARTKKNLKRISDMTSYFATSLTRELASSGFKPSFFEFDISPKSGAGLLPIKLSLEDGGYITLGGIADRVDTMIKGGKLYIRVADYKTGARKFSLEDVRAGLSLQLLIYLFSIWENADEAFKRAVGAPVDCEVIPAAAEYMMTSPDKPPSTFDEDVLATALSKSFKRSGIYLADTDIINELDRSDESKYAPLCKLKDTSSATLCDLERMNEIKNEVSRILIDIGTGIRHGNAEIKPIAPTPTMTTHPCEYCSMKPVCKNVASRVGDDEL